jgi:hypothetical protein
MKRHFVLAAVFALLGVAVLAQDRTPRVNARQGVQRGRIAEGRAGGEITRGEAAALNRQQRHIRRSERRAKSDGDVTLAERRRLDRKQDRASRNIRRAKRNNIDRN